MISFAILLACVVSIGVSENACYWNRECPYLLYSTKIPYDTIRGDIRDYDNPENCEAVSIWSLHRHGNRNPGTNVTAAIKAIAELKDDIIQSYEAGRGQLCAQDIEEFRKWTWNETLEVSQSHLTGTGYEELYDIGKRLREKYPHLVSGGQEEFHFRPTNEQRTITSAAAFVHGLTAGTNVTLAVDAALERDDIIRSYQNCDRYQEEVKTSAAVTGEVASYASTAEYIAVQNRVQQRLGITYQLTEDDIYSLYEICRFHRSWTPTLQSPWCAAFDNEDLVILEYRDDVRHYYRNGYGSWVNVNLGGPPMKDLYENLLAASQGQGKKITSYFSHDTMMEMVWCSLGLFRDVSPLVGNRRDVNRLWRTSFIAALSTNLIAVLNRCQESGSQTHRVQFFINEKVTDLCPESGCTWAQFQDKFQPFLNANLEFCSLEYREVADNGAMTSRAGWVVLLLVQIVLFLKW